MLQTCYRTPTKLHASYVTSQERLCSEKLVAFITPMVIQLWIFWLKEPTNTNCILVGNPFEELLGEMRYRWESEEGRN
jgi:hypothetical protein